MKSFIGNIKDGKNPGPEKRERGASALEFALVLPVLLIILFGIIEFGLLMYNKQVLTNASREGARAGIVVASSRLDCSDISEVVDSYCGDHLVTFSSTPSDPTTTCTKPDSPEFGDDLRVTVSYQYDFLLLPNFVGSLGGGITLKAATVMRYE